MRRIAVLGLRKDRQTIISILHDLNAVQLESLSKDVATMLRNERDNDLFRQVSDHLLRMKALRTVLLPVEVNQCQRFTSVDQLMEAAESIDIDDKVAELEREKENLLTNLKAKHTETSQKLQGIDRTLAEISKIHYVNIVCIEEQLEIENKKLEVIDNLGVTSDSFALEGWIPKAKVNQLKSTFEKHAKGTMLFELETDENPPTLFAN